MGINEDHKESQRANLKFKFQFLKKVKIRDLLMEDADKVLELIKENYGYNYPEQEFYQKDVINSYLKRAINKEGVYWKGAFFEGTLIGQLIGEIKHGISILKLAIVKDQFKRLGVMKLLSYEIERVTTNHSISDFRCVYALISKNNISMQNHIVKYNYVRLGTTPLWDYNEAFVIYGIVVYDYHWKPVKPQAKLYNQIYQTIKDANLNRFIIINILPPPEKTLIEVKKLNIQFVEKRYPQKILINTLYSNGTREISAEFYENSYQKTWYDLRFSKAISLDLKELIAQKILELFERNKEINSLSFCVDANDSNLQNSLLKLDFNYHAFLPFYLDGVDAILMGKSKLD